MPCCKNRVSASTGTILGQNKRLATFNINPLLNNTLEAPLIYVYGIRERKKRLFRYVISLDILLERRTVYVNILFSSALSLSLQNMSRLVPTRTGLSPSCLLTAFSYLQSEKIAAHSVA